MSFLPFGCLSLLVAVVVSPGLLRRAAPDPSAGRGKFDRRVFERVLPHVQRAVRIAREDKVWPRLLPGIRHGCDAGVLVRSNDTISQQNSKFDKKKMLSSFFFLRYNEKTKKMRVSAVEPKPRRRCERAVASWKGAHWKTYTGIYRHKQTM